MGIVFLLNYVCRLFRSAFLVQCCSFLSSVAVSRPSSVAVSRPVLQFLVRPGRYFSSSLLVYFRKCVPVRRHNSTFRQCVLASVHTECVPTSRQCVRRSTSLSRLLLYYFLFVRQCVQCPRWSTTFRQCVHAVSSFVCTTFRQCVQCPQ